MKRYLYNYQTIVEFSEPVTAHAVMLRCQPAANAFQTIEQEHVVVSPDYWTNAGTDAFGNRILFGGGCFDRRRSNHGREGAATMSQGI